MRKSFLKFRFRYWGYYRQLSAYRTSPTPQEAEQLAQEFDKLFSTVSGYKELDERISIILEKKSQLLLILKHPELPLHNNPAELGVMQRVRKRDISL